MPTPSHGLLREQRARKKAQPELNREHYDILVGRPYGESLRNHLQRNDVRIIRMVDEFVHIIELEGDSDLDRVEQLIEDWTNGTDFTPHLA